MANIRKNKMAARCIVAAGTLLASLGIWASVANHPDFSQSAVQDSAPLTANLSPEFSNDPGLLATTGTQAVPAAPPQTLPAQTGQVAAIPAVNTPGPIPTVNPSAPAPTPAPVQITPPVTTTSKPAPVPTTQPITTPAPVRPVPTTTPRLRTRAS